MELTESQILDRLLSEIKINADKLYYVNLNIKQVKVVSNINTDDYQKYKNACESKKLTISFLMEGWRDSNEDEFAKFIQEYIIDNNEDFNPIVDLEVFLLKNKGKIEVQLNLLLVYLDSPEALLGGSSVDNSIEKEEIIHEIELKLSQIYTLLKKL